MSGRNPHYSEPDEMRPRVVTFHGGCEGMLGICFERGIEVALHKPELNSRTMDLLITASRRQIKDMEREDTERVTRDDWRRTREWWRAWHLSQMADPPRNGWNEEYLHRSRLYFEPETIGIVCLSRGLTALIVRIIPEGYYSVLNVTATLPKYRAAQFEWIQRMILDHPNPLVPDAVKQEIDLMA